MRFLVPLAVILATAGGCNGGDDTCVADLELDCAPLYTPDFDEIFTRTLEPKCALAGGACHSREGAQRGLVFEDPDESYMLLLNPVDADPRVEPGDPACSTLVRRLESDKASFQMPPRNPLSEAERCVFRKWIEAGAPR